MKFARILILLILVVALLGTSNVDAAKKKKKSKKAKSKASAAAPATGTLDELLEKADMNITPEEAQANLEAAMAKADKEEEKAALQAKDKADDEVKAVKPKEPIKKIGGKRSTKDWSKISESDLEKDWEKGDDEEELEHEYDHSQKVIEKKKQQAIC